MNRMWINQPSTQQPHHPMHGTNVLTRGVPNDRGIVRVYLLAGDVISMNVMFNSLSKGWK